MKFNKKQYEFHPISQFHSIGKWPVQRRKTSWISSMTVTVWKHTVYIRPLLYLICLLPTKVAQFHNNLDTFSIATSGRKTLTVTQSFCDPQPLAKFRLHAGEHGKGDYSDHTAYESMLELSSRGWAYQQRPGSKQLPSYKKGAIRCGTTASIFVASTYKFCCFRNRCLQPGFRRYVTFRLQRTTGRWFFCCNTHRIWTASSPDKRWTSTNFFSNKFQEDLEDRERISWNRNLEAGSGSGVWTFNFITNCLCNFQLNYHSTFRKLQHKDASCKIMWIVFRKEGPDWTTHESQWVRVFTLQALSLEAGFRVPKHHQVHEGEEEEEGLSLEEEGVWPATRKYRQFQILPSQALNWRIHQNLIQKLVLLRERQVMCPVKSLGMKSSMTPQRQQPKCWRDPAAVMRMPLFLFVPERNQWMRLQPLCGIAQRFGLTILQWFVEQTRRFFGNAFR